MRHPAGRVAGATVAEAVRGGLDCREVTSLRGVIQHFPGVRKNWAYTFLVDEEPEPIGRPAGAIGWAGLANLYY
ncbi:putative 1,4-butanediol diacrylate esterase (plasmid) [Rhodococcus sp. WAY2]|nr:hypothetical protein [Rhodococcus sp. WAY2]QHE74018.1 putative 1,4-butanediol diacrylate esterase [Rhodococcus sp. WAY2]